MDRHNFWILFLASPSAVFLFCGIVNQFSITIIPSILMSGVCFYSEPKLKNGSFVHRDRKRIIAVETSYVIGSKILTRLPMNIFTCFLIKKLGSDYVILLGFLVYSCMIIIYIYSKSCMYFIFGRIVEGVAESLVTTSSYSFLSSAFDKRHSKSVAMGIANFFYIIGTSIGPFLGGILYYNFQHILTYVAIIPIHFILCCLLLVNCIYWNKYIKTLNRPSVATSYTSSYSSFEINTPSLLWKILTNPYIIINCLGIAICNGTIGGLSSSLPIWMENSYRNNKPEQGMVWMLGGIIYGLAQVISAYVQRKWNSRCYIIPLIGLCFLSLGLLTISFHISWILLTLNISMMFFGIGLLEFYLFPSMVSICSSFVEYQSDSISATLMTTSSNAGYLMGSILTGLLTELIGFRLNYIVFGTLVGLYAPFLFLLRNFVKGDELSIIYQDNEKKENNEILQSYELTGIFPKLSSSSRLTII